MGKTFGATVTNAPTSSSYVELESSPSAFFATLMFLWERLNKIFWVVKPSIDTHNKYNGLKAGVSDDN
ncbi:hypothetical protein SLA2020_472370 [Shorea laevis]